MEKALKKFDKLIVMLLIVMMAVTVFLSTLELGYILIKDIATPPVALLDINQLLEVFGMFMLVLIGIELLETMKTFMMENIIRVRVIFTVALIAVSRKVIILDVKKLPSLTLIGIAAIIMGLAAGYFLLKRSGE
jgi:uncharacterized membrane protein (DUF373 family)